MGQNHIGAVSWSDTWSRKFPPDAIFRIASMTKAITSAAAMQLIERAKRVRLAGHFAGDRRNGRRREMTAGSRQPLQDSHGSVEVIR
jgi:hypothetical protein